MHDPDPRVDGSRSIVQTDQGTLDCVVVGHYDTGFAPFAELLSLRGTHSGSYRNLRMDFVTIDGRKLPYLDLLNELTGQRLHWTELPQVAPFYLASFLSRRDLRARAASFFHARRAELEDLVRRARVVAVTTTLYLSPMPAATVVGLIRGINPGAHVVVGGPLVDNLHYHLGAEDFGSVLADIGADTYVLEKQGEQTLSELVACLRDGGDLGQVANCYVQANGGYRYTGASPENNPLDECAIDWDLFSDVELSPAVQTRTARSCAFSCSFCDYPTRAGQLALAGLEAVEAELRQLARRGVQRVVFVDDTFNVPINRFKDICRLMIRNRFNFTWYSYFRCSNARDEETFDLMAESGCRGVFLGIESGDSKILQHMHKVATPDQYRWGMERLHQRGILTFGSFIVGFPGETPETVQTTIDFINETRPTFFRGEIWYYNHRSPIHRERERFALEGMGHRWSHATMRWDEACDLVERLFDEVTGSVWLPMYDLDFWILPYLDGKGIDALQFERFVRASNRLLACELGTPASESLPPREALEAELRRVCASIVGPEAAPRPAAVES